MPFFLYSRQTIVAKVGKHVVLPQWFAAFLTSIGTMREADIIFGREACSLRASEFHTLTQAAQQQAYGRVDFQTLLEETVLATSLGVALNAHTSPCRFQEYLRWDGTVLKEKRKAMRHLKKP